MKQYVNTTTGEEVSKADIYALHPKTIFAASDWPPAPFAEIVETAPPAVARYKRAVAGPVVRELDGTWVRTWVIEDFTPTEIDAEKAIARQQKILEIEAYRDQLVDTGGYKITVGGQTYWIASDQKSKVRQLGLTMMGANVPAKAWRALDGRTVTLNQAVVQAIFNAAAAQELAIDDAGEVHKAAVMAATEPADYDFSAGWPETFKS